MHFFQYRGNELYAEDVAVKELAEQYGTPLYIYSYNTLVRHFKAYEDAYHYIPHIICYALKANSNGAILKLLASRDVCRYRFAERTLRALKAGYCSEIVYAGVGRKQKKRSALRLRQKV
jgi:diaminopimelate decarboxylase